MTMTEKKKKTTTMNNLEIMKISFHFTFEKTRNETILMLDCDVLADFKVFRIFSGEAHQSKTLHFFRHFIVRFYRLENGFPSEHNNKITRQGRFVHLQNQFILCFN